VKRRIVFSNYDDVKNPFYGGGGAHAVHEIARRLAQCHSVRVVTGKYPGSCDESVDGVSYARIGSQSAGAKAGQLLFQFTLPLLVRRGEYDIWVESLTPPFSTACLQLFTKKPVVALTQVLAGQAMTRKYKLPFVWAERLGLRTYRHAIALSPFLESEIKRANPRAHVKVIPNGIDREQIAMEVSKEEKHILFLGRLDVEQKGLDLLLDAFRTVVQEVPQPLILAGSGSRADEAYVSRRIREFGLQGRVHTVGRVGGQAKAEHLRQAMFLVMPSRFEASPIVALEAFCYRLPVVLFAIPELAEMPGNCCCKVAPFNVPALAQAIVTLARDPAQREAMGLAAKAFVRQFDWDRLAGWYEDFFESVLRKG
jgi:phosphatidylinositol alpha-mannosyltransferase